MLLSVLNRKLAFKHFIIDIGDRNFHLLGVFVFQDLVLVFTLDRDFNLNLPQGKRKTFPKSLSFKQNRTSRTAKINTLIQRYRIKNLLLKTSAFFLGLEVGFKKLIQLA